MIFTSSNYEDIARYYRNTYVKFKEMGDKLFFIRRVDGYSVTGQDEDGQEFELFLSDEHPYEVDYILPRKSFFQYGKRAALLQRIPAKQYQRGISSGNTSVVSLNNQGGVAKHEIGFETLRPFVTKQKYLALDEAIQNKARNISVVLSPRFAYIPAVKFLFVDTKPVASVDLKEKTITLSHPIFKNEVEQLCKNTVYKVV